LALRRAKQVALDVPQLAGLIASQVSKGINLQQALEAAVSHLPTGRLACDMRGVVKRTKCGEPIGEALAAVLKRGSLPDFRALAMLLQLASRADGINAKVFAPFAEALRAYRNGIVVIQRRASKHRRIVLLCFGSLTGLYLWLRMLMDASVALPFWPYKLNQLDDLFAASCFTAVACALTLTASYSYEGYDDL
jgi:hypothetical protein